MPTAYISHTDCRKHDTGQGHPENSRRLAAIEDRFVESGLFDVLSCVDAPKVSREQLLRAHSRQHIETVETTSPSSGYAHLDPDTVISPDSLDAARRAAGAAVAAVDLVIGGKASSAFCGVRPPGHHAESDRAMGFCLFNNIAVGAAHALHEHGLKKIAILDFDVHHGNGTEDIFKDEREYSSVLHSSIRFILSQLCWMTRQTESMSHSKLPRQVRSSAQLWSNTGFRP